METQIDSKEVLMYSLPGCPFCDRADELLRTKGFVARQIDVSKPEGRAELLAKGDYKTVPQIFVDGKNIGGFDEISAMNEKGELDEVLGV